MALDTTVGGVNSDSYAAIADFRAYVTSRLTTDYSGISDDIVEKQLRLARDYMDERWPWIGVKASQAQALQWPRESNFYKFISRTVIPAPIIRAQILYAVALQDGELVLNQSLSTGGVIEETSRAGALSHTKRYASATSSRLDDSGPDGGFPRITRILAPYISQEMFELKTVKLVRG